MPPRSDEVFARGLDAFGAVVARLDDADWDRPSPCAGWTARDVLGHLGAAIEMGIGYMRGERPAWRDADRPGEMVEGHPRAYWEGIATRARAALDGADLAQELDTPMGRRTVEDGLAFPAIDLFVHAWDVGRAAGIDVTIPDDVIAFAHGYIDPLPEEMVRGARGAFGRVVEPPVGASPTEAFVAWTGRDPR
jgi:uncharacterized protein (TIGR03086 family)